MFKLSKMMVMVPFYYIVVKGARLTKNSNIINYIENKEAQYYTFLFCSLHGV